MLIGRPQWLTELDKLRLPYNVNVVTQKIATHVLGYPDVLQAQAAAIVDERARVSAALSSLPGVRRISECGQFHPVSRALCRQRVRGLEVARRADQESERIASHPDRLSARYDRHRRRRTRNS
jgi:hypothetical protein